jgi:hypothetical protein
MKPLKPASEELAADPAIARAYARAAFALETAEAFGVKFLFRLEAEYPDTLPLDCLHNLQRYIHRDRDIITALLMRRAG